MRIGKKVSYLAAPLLVAALAACGGGENNQSTANTAAVTPDTTTTAAPAPAAAPAGSAAAPAATGAVAANLPEGVTPAMVQEGKQIFTSSGPCYTCHGPDAKGTALAPDLTDNQWIWITPGPNEYNELVTRIKEGVPQPKEHPAPMPPMGGATLTDAQVHAVAAYVYSLSHS